MRSCGIDQFPDILIDCIVNINFMDLILQPQKFCSVHHRFYQIQRIGCDLAFYDLQLIFHIRVPDVHTDHKTVELRLRQHGGSGTSHRILCRDDHERLRQFMRDLIHRYLPLFHDFQKRCLRLW